MIFIGWKKDSFRSGWIIRVIFCAVVLLSLAGCSMNSGIRKDPDHTVVVLHSYSDMGQEGSYFRNYLIHKESPFVDENGNDRFIETVHSYNPDILLINDDLAFHYILENEDALLQTIPSVFAGVSAATFVHQDYPFVTGLGRVSG